MPAREWLILGCRLLGVYLAVHGTAVGLAALVTVVDVTFLHMVGRGAPYLVDASVNIFALLHPIVYIAAGVCLMRKTEWCLKVLFGSAEMDTRAGDGIGPAEENHG